MVRLPHLILAIWVANRATIFAVEIIAHRGASHDAPENTLAAFRLGLKQAANAVELDVQLSKDGQLVVIHDENTKRTGGVDKRVADQTLAELRTLDVGRWKGSEWFGERIPTLAEALELVPEGKRVFVELKCSSDGVAEFKRIADGRRKGSRQIVAIGFSAETMARVKKAMPELEVCWIAKFKRNWNSGRWTPTASQLIQTAREAGLDGVDLDARGPVDVGLVRELKAAKLKVYVWTVDSALVARRLAQIGVVWITPNRPGWLREKLR